MAAERGSNDPGETMVKFMTQVTRQLEALEKSVNVLQYSLRQPTSVDEWRSRESAALKPRKHTATELGRLHHSQDEYAKTPEEAMACRGPVSAW